MTNEQVNEVLAKWHNDKWPEGWVDFTHGRIFTRAIDDSCSESHRPYTESLDTMRLIEDLIPAYQRREYASVLESEVGGYMWFTVLSTAEQRARAAVRVLGLEVEDE